jgi:hypothetical protein
MSDHCVRSIGLQAVAAKEIDADPVRASERPHSPGGEQRAGQSHADADQLQLVCDRERRLVDERSDEKWDPYEGGGVADPPRRIRTDPAVALPTDEPERADGQEDDVSDEDDRDPQSALVQATIVT